MKIFTAPFEGNDVFFYNMDGNVGLNSPNKPEDVQLVQFGYYALAQNNSPEIPQALRAVAANVVPGAPYTGTANDPLTIAIKMDEMLRGGVQDGHISVIRGGVLYDGAHPFILTRLVNNMRSLMPADFPRLDKNPKCPPQLAAGVKRCFTRGGK